MSGGRVLQTNSNSKCQDLPEFSFGGRDECGEGTSDQLKLKVPRSAQICILGGGGWGGVGGYSRPTFLKYLSGGTQGILNQKFLATGKCSASQIVSHILRMSD